MDVYKALSFRLFFIWEFKKKAKRKRIMDREHIRMSVMKIVLKRSILKSHKSYM